MSLSPQHSTSSPERRSWSSWLRSTFGKQPASTEHASTVSDILRPDQLLREQHTRQHTLQHIRSTPISSCLQQEGGKAKMRQRRPRSDHVERTRPCWMRPPLFHLGISLVGGGGGVASLLRGGGVVASLLEHTARLSTTANVCCYFGNPHVSPLTGQKPPQNQKERKTTITSDRKGQRSATKRRKVRIIYNSR